MALVIELWCTDYKGKFLLDNRQYCYPLTVTETTRDFPNYASESWGA